MFETELYSFEFAAGACLFVWALIAVFFCVLIISFVLFFSFLLTLSVRQVSDYGMQQCRSTVVHVSAKPELRLDPPSATVYRGDSVRIRCLSSDIDQSNGYSWTKNNALFQSDAETELWEDLYPDGSILKINNIQVIYIHYTGCPFALFYTQCVYMLYRKAGVCVRVWMPFLSSISLVCFFLSTKNLLMVNSRVCIFE